MSAKACLCWWRGRGRSGEFGSSRGLAQGKKLSLRKLPADLHHLFWIILKLESFLCQSLTFLIPMMLPPGLNKGYEQICISQVSFMGATKWHVWDGKLLPFGLNGRRCVKSCPLWWVTEFEKGFSVSVPGGTWTARLVFILDSESVPGPVCKVYMRTQAKKKKNTSSNHWSGFKYWITNNQYRIRAYIDHDGAGLTRMTSTGGQIHPDWCIQRETPGIKYI